MSKEKIDPLTGEVTTVRTVGEVKAMAEEHVVNRHHDPKSPRYRRRAEYLNDLGQEIPDPRPISPPIGYKRQPSVFDLQRENLALAMRLNREDAEFETFEESEDFDVDDDDYDPSSPWENDFDPPFSEIRAAVEEVSAKIAANRPLTPESLSAAAPAAASAPSTPTVPSTPPGTVAQDKP